ncbi:hypothetical protein JCM33374_g6405 [Metschnikowia sp. JCM 33374]|nr:hypothetical protein JCM33374_g6405 [Metschnikowia sp. JCM 33374]
MTSTLPLVNLVDSFPYEADEFYWSFTTSCNQLLGYITPEVAQRFKASDHVQYFDIDSEIKQVKISEKLDTLEKRNTIFEEIASSWKITDSLLSDGWRGELYTVYCPRSTPYVRLERAFACLLGVVTYGIHITGYVPPHKTQDNVLKIWIPRRSMTKQTYPGRLDNTIAGGLAYPYSISENAIKECYEEGGFSEVFVKKNLVAAGVLSYMCQPYGSRGHVQPEVEYIYDLTFESETDNIPNPIDGEAEDFKLMPITEVYERMTNGEFKPNCALVIIDFMIRHGYLTWENEANYLEILTRIHRRLPFPTMN